MKTVSVYEARNRFSQLLKDAAAGEEIVVTNRGEPVVRITGVAREENELRPGNPALIAKWLEEHPFPEHSRRSKEEIDRYLAEERDSWD